MISLCIPYYEDPNRLRGILMNDWIELFDEVIIVDDGSVDYPAEPIIKEFEDEGIFWYTNLSLYRIDVDFGFNAHGARNLAAQEATGDWLFFMDVDAELNEGFTKELLERVQSTPEGSFIVASLLGGDSGNAFCVRTEDFWRAGGYDEELRGYHMGDKIFRERLDQICTPELTENNLPCNRMGRTVYTDDTITGTYYPDDLSVVQRDQKHIKDILEMVWKRNKSQSEWASIPTINFDWRKIY